MGFKGIRLHGSSLVAGENSLVLLQAFALLQGDLWNKGFFFADDRGGHFRGISLTKPH